MEYLILRCGNALKNVEILFTETEKSNVQKIEIQTLQELYFWKVGVFPLELFGSEIWKIKNNQNPFPWTTTCKKNK